ncbi:MAG: glutamine--fructose-6-phosphate transaminase (isomerizing) [Phycisphaerales bacterium]|nr:glutamine--fructose-6-phosphate transaminase (isomerizing) [Phycisphaerales bacterium]
MCGIVAYIGSRPCRSLLIEGIKRLEYRGYDSAGIAVITPDQTTGEPALLIERKAGRISVLEEALTHRPEIDGTLGIAHTRWATHGEPNDANAHPQCDGPTGSAQCRGITLVHNGIIENYSAIRTYLEEKGRVFTSDTDTEVLCQLISQLYDGDLQTAVQAALCEVTGAYAIAVICEHEPDTLVVARKGSPLIVGVGNGEYIVGSDPAAIVAHTTQAFTLDDYGVCKLTRTGFHTTTIDNLPVTPKIQAVELDLEAIELGGYSHHMLKEIFEQPRSIEISLRGRIHTREGSVVLGGVSEFARDLVRARRVILLGQGTALHAAMIGEYLFEDLAKIPAEVEYSSEFRYRSPIIEEGTVVIAVSQSGETADTLAALDEAKQRGALTLGVVNVVGSTIARETDAGVYLRVGPEIGVASTKAFTGQVAVLSLLSLFLGRRRFMNANHVRQLLAQLANVPTMIERILESSDAIRTVAERYVDKENWLFLGRGYNYPVALEGALKLKEISYIHAEGYPAAEMKHGPIALIDENMPVVVIALEGPIYGKVMSNIAEVKARQGRVIAIATEGDTEIADRADHVIYIPKTFRLLTPLLSVIPLQLLAYHIAVMRGCHVDQPRNLAKSVTVE